MSFSRKLSIWFRVSICGSAAVLLFWTAWQLSVGAVPIAHEPIFASGVSRWWDAALIPPVTALLVVMFTGARRHSRTDHAFASASVLILGLFGGLLNGLTASQIGDLTITLASATLGGVMGWFVAAFGTGMRLDLRLGTGIAAVLAAAYGLLLGLFAGLTVGSGMLACAILIVAGQSILLVRLPRSTSAWL